MTSQVIALLYIGRNAVEKESGSVPVSIIQRKIVVAHWVTFQVAERSA